MPGYLIPLTSLQRTRLKALLAEVKGEDAVLDTVARTLNQVERVSNIEKAQLMAMVEDKNILDWDWIELLRQKFSAAGPGEWSTGEILELVMHSSHKTLWQPRSQ